MCGIAGAVVWDGAPAPDPTPAVTAMVEALGHRGPDGRGVVVCETMGQSRRSSPAVALGHTRLAILDLTDRAAQPMPGRDRRTWITYNGEVYNFEAVRQDLVARGRHFTSRSDTEVILQGYEEWGLAVLDRLRGMFALAIWDGTRHELVLARDRLGIKPLYVYQDATRLLFASEIRALLATGLVPRRLDPSSIESYLAHQTVPPPHTLVAGVRMILPGHSARVAGGTGQVDERRYWDLLDDAAVEARGASRDRARTRVRELLVESTSLHFVSDVPVGIFLSGGIDSSALVALTREAGITPSTFAVVLPGSAHDEAPFARTIAQRFGAEHVEIALGERELRDLLPDAMASVDHPSGDGFNTYVVSQAVRKAGVKVALSGLGGDELFGGYPSFRRIGRLAPYARAWGRSPAPMRAAAAAAVRALGGASVASVKAAAVLEGDGSVAQLFPVMRQSFSAGQRRELLGAEATRRARREGDAYVALIKAAVERHPRAELMSLIWYAEARTYMHDVLLRDTDQMSMARGLEVRVPLLDHRLVEYMMGLSDAAKQPGEVAKGLLVESLGSVLPDECVRRPKQGFVLPFDTWMRGDLRLFCEHHLGAQGLTGRGVFQEGALGMLWQSFLARDGRTSWSRPWMLVALNAWMEQNGISA